MKTGEISEIIGYRVNRKLPHSSVLISCHAEPAHPVNQPIEVMHHMNSLQRSIPSIPLLLLQHHI